jgi:hypothetical protein
LAKILGKELGTSEILFRRMPQKRRKEIKK